jgi:hypothetical protein
VDRADVEPGQKDYRIYQDATLRAEGRIETARPATGYNQQTAKLIGEGIAGQFARRLIAWQTRYEPDTETPPNLNTDYGLSQEEILFDLIETAQTYDGGDYGITQGTHTGSAVPRRHWWCAEDGVVLASVFDNFSSLANGIDWAITPTLTDDAFRELTTWNPSRGTDLSGSVVFSGTEYLDNLTYEIDARQMVTVGRTVGEGECEPPMGYAVAATALANYGLREAFESADTDDPAETDELARGLLSTSPLAGFDVYYQLSAGEPLGTYDIADTIRLTSPRSGWELDVDAYVQEVTVTCDLPNDDEHTFVRVNLTEVQEAAEDSS